MLVIHHTPILIVIFLAPFLTRGTEGLQGVISPNQFVSLLFPLQGAAPAPDETRWRIEQLPGGFEQCGVSSQLE